MPLTFRHDKGAPLTSEEADDNVHDLDDRLTALEENPTPPISIANVTTTGKTFTIWLTDGSSLGPYQLPVAAFNWRGDWLPDTGYFEYDLVENGLDGLFLVLQNHVSGSEFDPDVENSGEPVYQQIIGPFVAGSISTLEDVNHDFAPAHNAILRYYSYDPDDESLVNEWRQEHDTGVKTVTTATYTLGWKDLFKYIRFTHQDGCTVTMSSVGDDDFWALFTQQPPGGGQEIHLRQAGGPLVFVEALNVTLNGVQGFLLATDRQGAVVTFKYVQENVWDVFGLLAPDTSAEET